MKPQPSKKRQQPRQKASSRPAGALAADPRPSPGPRTRTRRGSVLPQESAGTQMKDLARFLLEAVVCDSNSERSGSAAEIVGLSVPKQTVSVD